ncbi:hypothetical protein P7M03_16700 [Vibrio parahaemolyticus]|nr:hypothetical protein [Vibrio parahaemolyticus]QOW05807.1 hypothetical protein IC830_07170 [Vibrio parahaemolyticus]
MKNLKTKLMAGAVALASASSFAAVDANVQAGLDSMQASATELSAAGLTAIIALGVVSMGIAVVIGIFRWAKRAAVN